MALCRGLPVILLNATVVSLWLVIPIAFTFAEVNECLIDRLSRHSITWDKISKGSCSHHPGYNDICLCSLFSLSITFKSLLTRSTLDDVVPYFMLQNALILNLLPRYILEIP